MQPEKKRGPGRPPGPRRAPAVDADGVPLEVDDEPTAYEIVVKQLDYGQLKARCAEMGAEGFQLVSSHTMNAGSFILFFQRPARG